MCFACEPSRENTISIQGLILLGGLMDHQVLWKGWEATEPLWVGRSMALSAPTTMAFVHFEVHDMYNYGTMLFVQKLLLLCLLPPKIVFRWWFWLCKCMMTLPSRVFSEATVVMTCTQMAYTSKCRWSWPIHRWLVLQIKVDHDLYMDDLYFKTTVILTCTHADQTTKRRC